MTRIFLSILFCLATVCAAADTPADSIKAQADSAYVHEQYDEAIALYTQLADMGQSAVVYYNLGCAHYRKGDIARSILWLERASLLDPGNNDIAYNLQLVRGKTIDRIEPAHEFFMVELWRGLVNAMDTDAWAMLAVVCFGLMLASLSVRLFSSRVAVRRVSLYVGMCFLVLCLLGNACALQQSSYVRHHASGVIISSSVTVKSTPAESGNDLFVIHEGTHVDIQDDSMKEWAEVRIADGKVGWVPKKSFERI